MRTYLQATTQEEVEQSEPTWHKFFLSFVDTLKTLGRKYATGEITRQQVFEEASVFMIQQHDFGNACDFDKLLEKMTEAWLALQTHMDKVSSKRFERDMARHALISNLKKILKNEQAMWGTGIPITVRWWYSWTLSMQRHYLH